MKHGTATVFFCRECVPVVDALEADEFSPGEGMLFRYGRESNRDIVLRNMDFGLDVVYIGSNGTITGVATLDAPDGPVESHLTYDSTSGVGQYILEVNAGWSNEHGVSPGDCVTGLR